MHFKTDNLDRRQLLAALVSALETDKLFRIELAQAMVNSLKHFDFITPYYDLQVMPQLLPCTTINRVNYFLSRYKEYFNAPTYRVVFTKVGTRSLSSRRRILTPEEVIHLRGFVLRPTSAWARATKRDHKLKHPELYATKAQIKEQQATNTGRYAYRANRSARIASCIVNPN